MPDDLLSGRYRLGAHLGTGGMADVYAATDERLGRQVAVKLFRSTGDARQQSEVQVLAGLNHPNLVAIYDAELGNPAYVVMELVDGRSLDELIAEGGRIDVGLLGSAVADALAYAHGQGVVHRDVKPGNVLVADDGRVKLADFGIARLVDQAHLTRTGQLMGTAAYLAPEQARGEASTGASDVYSLGLVLLECVTGRREYEGTATEAAVARLSRPPRVPADAPHARLLQDMTQTDPRLRPSAADVAARLRGDTRTAPLRPAPNPTQVLAPVVVEPAAVTEERRTGGWLWALVAFVVALAIAGAIVAIALTRGSDSPAVTPPTSSSTSTGSSSTSAAPTTSKPSTTSSAPTTSSTPPPSSSAPPTSSSPPPTSTAPQTTSSPGVSVSVP